MNTNVDKLYRSNVHEFDSTSSQQFSDTDARDPPPYPSSGHGERDALPKPVAEILSTPFMPSESEDGDALSKPLPQVLPHTTSRTSSLRVVTTEPLKLTDCGELVILTVSPLGLLGAHWFWLDRPMWGWLYFCTAGLCGVGWGIDILRLPHLAHRSKLGFDKDLTVDLLDMYVLCICPLTGLLGMHHWLMGNTKWAKWHACTCGFVCVGWALDILRLPFLVADHNKRARVQPLEQV
mmetsp:Transcript_8749/g.24130  ORF Transcript_8749/g.24130 Transcript_8749/m.24130 type:complete len:236 (-) Transcript_8749:306-1013(-)